MDLASIPPGQRRWILLSVIAGGILLVAGGIVWQLAHKRSQQELLEAQTELVQRKDVVIQVSAAGTIQPLTPVNISPKASGRLVTLLVDQGDLVTKGQILARMDNSNLLGPLRRARGNLAASKANLQEAEAQIKSVGDTYRFNQPLYKSGALSRNDFSTSQSVYFALRAHIQALRGQIEQSRGDLETAQAQLNDTVIRAPFSGVITQKYANVGAFVTPTTSASATSSATSSSILSLASPLEAVANVSETDAPSIYRGQPVEIQVDAYPHWLAHGRVRLIAPESVVVQNVTSFTVRITIDAADLPRLRSGMNITANFMVGRHLNALLIPTTAIVSQKEGTGVYLLDKGSKPKFHPIRVGATVGTMSEVLAGLQQGERVFITFPGARKPNGKPVKSSPFTQSGGAGRPPR